MMEGKKMNKDNVIQVDFRKEETHQMKSDVTPEELQEILKAIFGEDLQPESEK